MTREIVFKQRYRSRNLRCTPTLNKKHLIYIATRPGAIHNKNCGFSLFGRLNSECRCEDICDFENAKKQIYDVSKRRTLYRAILSLPHQVALDKGFYKREKWQKLIADKFASLAKNMDIEEKDFRYMAAFHYSKGHPHIHLMYWDDSNRVRQEFIQHDKFEIIAEKIRSDFSREIFREEIRSKQSEQKENRDLIKTELLSLFKELNAEDPIAVNRISKSDYAVVSNRFNELVKVMPSMPSFRYAYLDRKSKQAMQNLLDTVLVIPQFSAKLQQYMESTEEISKLYGNGKEKTDYQVEKSKREIYSALGNVALKFIKENDIRYCPHEDDVRCDFISMQEKLKQAVQGSIKPSDLYKNALSAFPAVRTPMKVFADEKFRNTVFQIVKEVLKADEIRLAVREYISDSVKYSVFSDEMKEITEEVLRCGDIELKEFADKIERQQYMDIFRETYRHILSQLYNDAGYERQYFFDCAQNLLIELFGSLSQSTNHAKASLSFYRARRGKEELSKDARKDFYAENNQSDNDWTQEI